MSTETGLAALAVIFITASLSLLARAIAALSPLLGAMAPKASAKTSPGMYTKEAKGNHTQYPTCRSQANAIFKEIGQKWPQNLKNVLASQGRRSQDAPFLPISRL